MGLKSLRNSREFHAVYKRGRSVVTKYIVMYYKKNDLMLDEYIVKSQKILNQIDIFLAPTTPIVPWPVKQNLDFDKAINYTTQLTRNTRVTSAMDVCSCSLPVSHLNDPSPKSPPVGLLLSCAHGQDRKLLSLSIKIQETLMNS